MKNINLCIGSDVTDSYVLINSVDFCEQINCEGFNFSDNEIELTTEELKGLYAKVEKAIDVFCAGAEVNVLAEDKFNPLVSLEYKGKEWKLNYRNRKEFIVGALISCHVIFDKTIKEDGSVFFFNRDYINIYESDSIVSQLKNDSLEFDRLLDNINKNKRITNTNLVTESLLLDGLKHLQNLGYIYINSKGRYQITTKGSLLVL